MPYDARYGTATPYGKATPNRRGISLRIARGDNQDTWSFEMATSVLQDLTPEGVDNRRVYMCSDAMGQFTVSSLWKGERKLKMNGGWRLQCANRDGTRFESVNLKSQVFDFGGTWDVMESVSLLYGVKRIRAIGTEYLALRDADFTITDFNKVTLDLMDEFQAMGLQWNLNKQTQATIQWQHWALNDFSNEQSAKISRVLFVFKTSF